MNENDCMDLWALVPELIIAGTALVLVPIAGWARSTGVRRLLTWLTCPTWIASAALLASMVATFRLSSFEPRSVFCDTYALDGTAAAFKLLLELGALLTLAALASYFRGAEALPHLPVALLLSTLGGMGVASALDLGLIVLFLQLLSLASYLLVAADRASRRAHESTLKYFIYAAVTLATMAYGLSFLYGLTGSLDLRVIGASMGAADPLWVAMAFGLILVGYGFECTLVPFHFWAPDVYEGATAPVAGFLSVVPKTAGFAGLIRFLLTALPDGAAHWPSVLAVLAAVTMTFGNLAALRQRSLKRLLAYSSIAQAGYVLAAVSVAGSTAGAVEASGYYLAAFLFMNLGAFFVIARMERSTGLDRIEIWRGLGWSAPGISAVFSLSLLSLAGFPPLAGFFGKVLVLKVVLDGGLTWLALLAVANMTLALFYYLKVVAEMYLYRPTLRVAPDEASGTRWATAVSVLGTLGLGIFPASALAILSKASELLE